MSTEPTFNLAAHAAREALNTLIQTGGSISQELTRQREKNPIRGRNIEGATLDGQPIEYWHSIATATLKTNDELIDRVKELKSTNDALVKCHQDQADSYTKRTDELIETRRRERVLLDQLREKERINADLEQQLKSAEIAAESLRKREEETSRVLNHQRDCATKAENERDAALRELDAMREKIKKKPKQDQEWTYLVSVNGGPSARVTKQAFFAMRDSAPTNGYEWHIRNDQDSVSELRIGS